MRGYGCPRLHVPVSAEDPCLALIQREEFSSRDRTESWGTAPWSLTGIDGASVRESGNGIGELAGIHHPITQLHPFLPPCPITSRHDVIPPGYNRRTKQIRHLDFSLKKPLRGCNRFENTGFTGLPVIQKKAKKPRDSTGPSVVRPCPGAIKTVSASSANGLWVIETLAK
jgi:hypothetical protein